MARDWRHKLDDLDQGDKIEIDCGDTLIRGRFDRMFKNPAGNWSIAIKAQGGREELAITREIDDLRIIGV